MKCKSMRRRGGYTLVEVVVAASISVVVIGAVTGAFVRGLIIWQQEQIRSELNMDLEIAMEKIRVDLRLSSVGVGLMTFYPATAREYSAISLPRADDSNGDGMLDRNADGKIRWTKTVVYHVVPSTPDRLVRVVFAPRNTNATPARLYQQLTQVVAARTDGDYAAACMTGEAVSRDVVFENLVDLTFRPPGAYFDTYAPTRRKARTHNWGSIVIGPGNHKVTFTVTGKNSASSAYNLDIDRFTLSASASPREGEICFPRGTHPTAGYFNYSVSSGVVTAADRSGTGNSWSGLSTLMFHPARVGASITFDVQNDLWCDTNFDSPPSALTSNCSVKIDPSFLSGFPPITDTVVSMDRGIAWSANACGAPGDPRVYTNAQVTIENILYGSGDSDQITITRNGCWAKVFFERAAGHAFYIDQASIVEPLSGSSAAITFNGGNHDVFMNSGGAVIQASDWVRMWEIDRTKSYLIRYNTERKSSSNAAAQWVNTNGVVLSRVGGVPTTSIIGVSALEVGYPKTAIYRSGVFDTGMPAPVYRYLTWTHVEKLSQGGDIDIRVRSGDAADLSGVSWQQARIFNNGYFQTCPPNALSALPRKRYVQYEALFTCGSNGAYPGAHTNDGLAVLRDVTIDWDGPTGLADLQVDFGMNSDGGMVEARVDGQSLIKGVEIEMQIFKAGRTGTNTVRGVAEVRPLNTGK